MIGRALLIIAVGLFGVWIGVRSASGYEDGAEHLYGGQFETITCEDGNPITGKGLHAQSAELACDEVRSSQRSRARWWIAGGLGVTVFGVT